MIHTVTITHIVEAPAWDLAVEAVLRDPVKHMSTCTVKAPGKALVHVAQGTFRHAAQQVEKANEDTRRLERCEEHEGDE